MSCRRESPRREFTPVLVPGREFHSGTKSRNANQRSGSDEKLSGHSDFSPDPELLTPTESRLSRRSFLDPICCNFCMVLSGGWGARLSEIAYIDDPPIYDITSGWIVTRGTEMDARCYLVSSLFLPTG